MQKLGLLLVISILVFSGCTGPEWGEESRCPNNLQTIAVSKDTSTWEEYENLDYNFFINIPDNYEVQTSTLRPSSGAIETLNIQSQIEVLFMGECGNYPFGRITIYPNTPRSVEILNKKQEFAKAPVYLKTTNDDSILYNYQSQQPFFLINTPNYIYYIAPWRKVEPYFLEFVKQFKNESRK